jgi:hypothetical protein
MEKRGYYRGGKGKETARRRLDVGELASYTMN